MSPRLSVGARTSFAQAANHSPVIGPSSTSGAVMPVSRSAPMKVVVCQWPCGTLMRKGFDGLAAQGIPPAGATLSGLAGAAT